MNLYYKYYTHRTSVIKTWPSEDNYKQFCEGTNLNYKLDSSINKITYSSVDKYIDYVKGWISCFINFSSQEEIDDFLLKLKKNFQGKNGIELEYKKIILKIEKE